MTGNCLKGSRGILSFDEAFGTTASGRLIKELFTHVRCDLVVFSHAHAKCVDVRYTSRGPPRETFHRSCLVIFYA